MADTGDTNNVVNFRQKRHEKRVAVKAKDCFNYIQSHGQTLSEEEYKDFIMVLLADLVVLIIRAGFYRNPATAIKNGVDWLVKKYGG
jgi:endonuclease III